MTVPLPTAESSLLGRAVGKAPRQAMSRHVADRIRDLIFDGTLTRGQRVPQDALAEELGVSRLPVREALIALETEGLVASEPHRGTFVVPILRADIEDHYRMYGLIQGLAASRAASVIDDATLRRLGDLHDAMSATSDLDSIHDLNWQFHALINQTGGSTRLISVLRQLGRNLPRSVYESASSSLAAANAGHQLILDALRDGDGEAANEASLQHTIDESRFVIERLRQRGVLAED